MIYNDIFNEQTLNIFTDASILQLPNEYIGCPGYLVIKTISDNLLQTIDTGYNILRKSTNNESEITAILMGVQTAIKYKDQYKTINLFSDSMICIHSLKYWIFNWINCIKNDKLFNTSKKEVANQSIIMSIIYTIVNNNLNINFYHQKGHVKMNQESIQNAKRVFKETNRMSENIQDHLIIKLSHYNNDIDILTKNVLNEISINNYKKYFNPLIYVPDRNMFKNEYKKLIGGNINEGI